MRHRIKAGKVGSVMKKCLMLLILATLVFMSCATQQESGKAYIHVQSQHRDPISFDGELMMPESHRAQ